MTLPREIVTAPNQDRQPRQNSPNGRQVLIILSDIHENAGEYKLEKLGHVRLSLARAAKARTVPDPKGVEVYVLGADNAVKSMNHWQTLRDFWATYFQKTGAQLKAYTVLRDPPLVR